MSKTPYHRRGPGPMDAAAHAFDPKDPIQIALKMAHLEAAQVSSHRDFTSTAANLNASIQGVQSELKTVVQELKQLNRLSDAHETHSQGLGRAFDAIKALADQTKASFAERDDGLESWKEKHVAENQQTRERLILWNGVATGISVLATTLVAVLVYVYVADKEASARELARVERESKEMHAQLRSIAESNSASLREVERYLTQEGTISSRPYAPNRR